MVTCDSHRHHAERHRMRADPVLAADVEQAIRHMLAAYKSRDLDVVMVCFAPDDDMLRFGYLLLNQGRWQDEQIVPTWYVRHATRRSPYNPHYPYSLQFDVNTDGDVPGLPRDAYWKSGSGGRALYVVPSLDLVVWKFGGRDGQYEQRDTGIEVHVGAACSADSRDGWRQTVDDRTALHETLRQVVAAIEELCRVIRTITK